MKEEEKTSGKGEGKVGKGEWGHKEVVEDDGDQKYKAKASDHLSRVGPRTSFASLDSLRLWLQRAFQSFPICVNKKEMILSTAQKKLL